MQSRLNRIAADGIDTCSWRPVDCWRAPTSSTSSCRIGRRISIDSISIKFTRDTWTLARVWKTLVKTLERDRSKERRQIRQQVNRFQMGGIQSCPTYPSVYHLNTGSHPHYSSWLAFNQHGVQHLLLMADVSRESSFIFFQYFIGWPWSTLTAAIQIQHPADEDEWNRNCSYRRGCWPAKDERYKFQLGRVGRKKPKFVESVNEQLEKEKLLGDFPWKSER